MQKRIIPMQSPRESSYVGCFLTHNTTIVGGGAVEGTQELMVERKAEQCKYKKKCRKLFQRKGFYETRKANLE